MPSRSPFCEGCRWPGTQCKAPATWEAKEEGRYPISVLLAQKACREALRASLGSFTAYRWHVHDREAADEYVENALSLLATRACDRPTFGRALGVAKHVIVDQILPKKPCRTCANAGGNNFPISAARHTQSRRDPRAPLYCTVLDLSQFRAAWGLTRQEVPDGEPVLVDGQLRPDPKTWCWRARPSSPQYGKLDTINGWDAYHDERHASARCGSCNALRRITRIQAPPAGRLFLCNRQLSEGKAPAGQFFGKIVVSRLGLKAAGCESYLRRQPEPPPPPQPPPRRFPDNLLRVAAYLGCSVDCRLAELFQNRIDGGPGAKPRPANLGLAEVARIFWRRYVMILLSRSEENDLIAESDARSLAMLAVGLVWGAEPAPMEEYLTRIVGKVIDAPRAARWNSVQRERLRELEQGRVDFMRADEIAGVFDDDDCIMVGRALRPPGSGRTQEVNLRWWSNYSSEVLPELVSSSAEQDSDITGRKDTDWVPIGDAILAPEYRQTGMDWDTSEGEGRVWRYLMTVLRERKSEWREKAMTKRRKKMGGSDGGTTGGIPVASASGGAADTDSPEDLLRVIDVEHSEQDGSLQDHPEMADLVAAWLLSPEERSQEDLRCLGHAYVCEDCRLQTNEILEVMRLEAGAEVEAIPEAEAVSGGVAGMATSEPEIGIEVVVKRLGKRIVYAMRSVVSGLILEPAQTFAPAATMGLKGGTARIRVVSPTEVEVPELGGAVVAKDSERGTSVSIRIRPIGDEVRIEWSDGELVPDHVPADWRSEAERLQLPIPPPGQEIRLVLAPRRMSSGRER